MELKLAKLPDRTPVKITITVGPDLNRMLGDYAALYNRQHEASETVADLCPYIIQAFLDNDKNFLKARKEIAPTSEAAPGPPVRRRARRSASSNDSNSHQATEG